MMEEAQHGPDTMRKICRTHEGTGKACGRKILKTPRMCAKCAKNMRNMGEICRNVQNMCSACPPPCMSGLKNSEWVTLHRRKPCLLPIPRKLSCPRNCHGLAKKLSASPRHLRIILGSAEFKRTSRNSLVYLDPKIFKSFNSKLFCNIFGYGCRSVCLLLFHLS